MKLKIRHHNVLTFQLEVWRTIYYYSLKKIKKIRYHNILTFQRKHASLYAHFAVNLLASPLYIQMTMWHELVKVFVCEELKFSLSTNNKNTQTEFTQRH